MSPDIHVCSDCGKEHIGSGAPGCDCVDTLLISGRVFNHLFIGEMMKYLTDKTVEGHCVTRVQLCKDLKLDPKLDSVVGAIINLGHMPGFKIYMGPNGGIGRTDRKPPKKTRAASGYTTDLSDEKAAEILAKLEELCGYGEVASRKKVASALGSPGTKTMNLVSIALKRPEFDDFATKNGKGGGVYKISARPDLVKRAARAAKASVAAPNEPATPKAPEPSPETESAPTEPATAQEVTQEVDSTVSEEEDLSVPLV